MYKYLTCCVSYIYKFFVKLSFRTRPDYEEALKEPFFDL